MPKKTVKELKKSGDEVVPFDKIQWVFNNLSTGELEMFDNNPLTLAQTLDGVHRLIEMGFKLSMKWDAFSETIQVTAVCNESVQENSGLATSARGNDAGDALALLVYKILIIAEGDLRPYIETSKRSNRG
jgi:hypothetical protein